MPHDVFRDARVGDPVHSPVIEGLLILRREGPPVRDELVLALAQKVEDILLEIRTRTGDRVDPILSNHAGQNDPQLPRGHRPGQGDQHLSPTRDVLLICPGGRHRLTRVEVEVMLLHEPANLTHRPTPTDRN